MSYLLELLGRGLEIEVGDVLAGVYGPPSTTPMDRLQRNVQEHPDRGDFRRELGIRYLRSQQVPEALGLLSVACQLGNDDTAARVALAAAFDAGGDVEDAAKHLERALVVLPRSPELLFALGVCYEKLNRPQDAAGRYREAVAIKSGFDAARERLAAVAVLRGDDSEAIAQYEILRQAAADETRHLSTLAHLYYRQGEFAKATAHFESAAVAGPENWALLDDEIETLVQAKRFSLAMLRLDDLIEKQPCFPDLHVRLGDLYAQLGQDDAAMACFVRATELQPDYMEAVIKIGTQHSANGRWDEAAEAFSQAAEINDRSLRNYIGLGLMQLAAGQTNQATVSFGLAGSIEPNTGQLTSETVRLQLMSAMAEEKVDRPGDGASSAKNKTDRGGLLTTQIERHCQGIAERPGQTDMRMRYAILLRSQGRLDEAAQQFRQVIEAVPAYMDAGIKLGITLMESDRTEEAAAAFQEAFRVAPEMIDFHYRLGLLHTDRRLFEKFITSKEQAAPADQRDGVRATLATSLQNMGLMDRSAATWRSLRQIHSAHAGRG